MALTVQQTIEIPRLQFFNKDFTCPLLGHTGANFAAHFHGVPQIPLLDKVVVPAVCTTNALIQMRSTVEVPQLQFFFKVVIIPVGAPRQVPMVSLFSRPRRFSCCSTLTRCSTIWLCSPAGSRVQSWRRRFRSHSCNVHAGHCCSHACRFETTGVGDGRDSAVNCGGSAVGAHRLACFFLGRVHRYTAGLTSPPLGRGRGGGDAGSLLPGVLPPKKLHVGTTMDRHGVFSMTRTTHTTTTTSCLHSRLPLFFCGDSVMDAGKRPSAGGVAMRRKQRRLRSWWRHEKRSVAALAAATHHSAPRSGWPVQHNTPRGPTTASAMEEEVREVNDALEGQKRPPPRGAAGTSV